MLKWIVSTLLTAGHKDLLAVAIGSVLANEHGLIELVVLLGIYEAATHAWRPITLAVHVLVHDGAALVDALLDVIVVFVFLLERDAGLIVVFYLDKAHFAAFSWRADLLVLDRLLDGLMEQASFGFAILCLLLLSKLFHFLIDVKVFVVVGVLLSISEVLRVEETALLARNSVNYFEFFAAILVEAEQLHVLLLVPLNESHRVLEVVLIFENTVLEHPDLVRLERLKECFGAILLDGHLLNIIFVFEAALIQIHR